jgi:hypothetical protein
MSILLSVPMALVAVSARVSTYAQASSIELKETVPHLD